ncbi:hypothetical protein ABW19_dt0201621 [Dactylella cylindrospora]|nr:hypothetical protein ABW19_dt0201621 [Dactylella cylindrospora]
MHEYVAEEIIHSPEEVESVDRLVEDKSDMVIPTPATSTPSATPSIRPQDLPVLPATPNLNDALPGRSKSPLPKVATPVISKKELGTESKSKKKDEKPQPPPTMAAIVKAAPPPAATSKITAKEAPARKHKPPTLPPLSAVIAAATAEPSSASTKADTATASPKVIKLPAINQSTEHSTPSSSVPPTPISAPAPTQRARTMRIISSTSTPTIKDEGKEKENQRDREKDKDDKTHPVPSSTAATRQGTRPATPASELISDTASTTSSKRGSISSPMVRSESVASGNVSVAGKVKSKSALKKERQAMAKTEEKEVVTTPSTPIEDHAPVIARARKKEKKGKAAAAGKTAKATNTAPASPKVATPVSAHATIEIEHRDDRSSRAGSISAAVAHEIHQEHIPEQVHPHDTETESAKPDLLSTITPNDIITALHESKEIDFTDLEMLKPVVGLQHRFEITANEIAEFGKRLSMAVAASATDVDDHQFRVEITTNASGNPTGQNNQGSAPTSRLIVTPGGVLLKGLTPEQEAKFIKLEERSSKTSTPLKPSDLVKSGLPAAKKDLAATLAGTLASRAASLADLSLEDTLAYLNQLNQFLEFSPETAAAAAAAASQLAQAHTQLSTGKFQPPPVQQPSASSKSSGSSSKKGKTPPSTAAGPPSPINPASVASAAVAAAAGSLEQMLMMGFQSAFTSKPATESTMSVEEAEKLLISSRKETEAYEKKLNNLVKRNKRLIFGALGMPI